ncbi:MAG: MtrB/PioB family outer membrane beta-barrel protein [Steroidobacteraceae bacterium]
MMCKLTLRAMLLSSVCLLPLKAMGADLGAPLAPDAMVSDNEISLGLGGLVGKNTNLYGRYNGFTEEGFDGLFGFSSITTGAWDSANTNYYIFRGYDLNFQTGTHLGTAQNPANPNFGGTSFSDPTYRSSTANDIGPMASLSFRIGDQGHWGITGSYDAISYTGNIIDSIYTVTGNSGVPLANINGLNGNWGGAALHAPGVTSFTPAQALAAEQPFQVGTRRDIFGLTGTYFWNDWKITAGVSQTHKEGTLEESFRSAYGGQAFTLPVNFDFQRYDVKADYTTYQVQAQVGYYLSNFTDHITAIALPYATSGTAPHYQQTSLFATPPSNMAQYWTGMVGYNVTPDTRVTANLRYGLETQNAGYPSNTGDPALVAGGPPGGLTGLNNFNGIWVGTSSPSPDIVAQVYQGSVRVTSSPMKNWNATADYYVDGRSVSLNQVGAVVGNGSSQDSGAQTPGSFVVPQDWLKQKAKGELDYRILPQTNTKLYATYQFDDVVRSNAQVGHSDTETVSVGVSSALGPVFSGRTFYTFADRSGVLDQWTAWSNLAGAASYGTPSAAYYQAPMTSNAANLRFDYAPGGAFSGGLQFKGQLDDFHYPNAITPDGVMQNVVNQVEGIKHDANLTAAIDGNYRPDASLNFHAYYSYEEIFYDNLGNGACSTAGAAGTGVNNALCGGNGVVGGPTTAAGYFQNKYNSGVHSVGLSAEWQATDRLKITGNYTFGYGAVMFGSFNGVFVPVATQTYQNVVNYPDDRTIMNAVTLKGTYQLTDNIELGAGIQYSQFYESNWEFQACAVQTNTPGTCPPTGATIGSLTAGYGNPNYSVLMAMAAVRVKW